MSSNLFAVVMENEDGEEIANENDPFLANVRNMIGISRAGAGVNQSIQTNGGSSDGPSVLQSNALQVSEMLYSGLYSYNILTNTWTQLRCDIMSVNHGYRSIRSRVGHSMLLHPVSNQSNYLFLCSES